MTNNMIMIENESTQNVEGKVDNNSNSGVASSSQIREQPGMEPEVDSAASKFCPHSQLQETSELHSIDATELGFDEGNTDTTLTSTDNRIEDKGYCIKEEQEADSDNSEYPGPMDILRKGAVAAVGGTMVRSHRECIISVEIRS
jgi:hypothetical protein